ncbi:response regulator transcription factor [Paenibacillus jilunlii]|uniref:DNA-binding response regulator, OmpR family, contains REC and winged-helix (WHTH) domain n=1 Tax=Paenibacillus jilunlii TaxID=682956 RepID=A0A1G9K927_9BACL|nr:response regulator transcription factor [Paenibacillus jilunlii]KWX70013.1 PhoB family transcriptional regulator [Paenibacillus jilunlii]SDL45773.1 DNA-binding response regulator, OmpR family, contains REC and winged-helix (wHTH) domain [Paenibacillus jilunlii]
MCTRILIVDDDRTIVDFLSIFLEREGYSISSCYEGETALDHIRNEAFQLILLDIMMPVLNGFDLIGRIREISEVPVIFLTAKDQQEDKIRGFIAGCDDYVTKPFDLTELSLRISAILKRSPAAAEQPAEAPGELQIKDVTLLPEEHAVSKNGVEINMTPKEYGILLLLARNKGRVFTSRDIYELVWEDTYLESDNTVLTHIRNLREKLGDTVKNSKYIRTVWGVGYKVDKEA